MIYSGNEVLVGICFVICVTTVLFVERFALPRAVHNDLNKNNSALIQDRFWTVAAWLFRLTIVAQVYMIFFAISWRPIYSTQAAITTFAVVTAISRAKFSFIREPLVFSDAVFIQDVFKHKTLFYTNFLGAIFIVFVLAYIFGTSALYFILESSILPTSDQHLWIVAIISLALFPSIVLLTPLSHCLSADWSRRLLGKHDAKLSTIRFGALCAVVLQFVVWLQKRREKRHEAFSSEGGKQDLRIKNTKSAAPIIIVWQSESFYDLRHLGRTELALPYLDRLREKAVQWGRLDTIFEGGYTLRTEFAVVSGLHPHDMSVDASHPYLSAINYADDTWSKKLQQAGWYTHFIHPYEANFFHRDKAVPAIGFSHMTMIDGFDHSTERDGQFVSDNKLAAKTFEVAHSVPIDTPAFIFTASMGNHGPWGNRRGIESSDPVEVYCHLLKEADQALGLLYKSLGTLERPVWLAFYGDHAPLLKALADPFPDPRTDYVIVPISTSLKQLADNDRNRSASPWKLLEIILSYAGVLEADHAT